ncbi:TVP38/TMEM64 family protein [Mycobacterium sp. 236(2023)]|uniref:TVP38/TMEM64 family protein n=1 Tax=Mycobacterium sp. 236(2023) TaxID=3038163 RepID=UPI0024155AC2|nr:TVP38/TMEM64 family protein [Mycobacterium sp. 236(2023)]MDG4668884.1 TVP38/TMEM64 family protein [Mycobacterium sp. 236(2023)]
MNSVVSTLRSVHAAVVTTLKTVPRTRLAAALTAIVILVAIALLVPLPTALQLRDWATSAGPWFPLAFFVAHVVMTVFPFPRTAFTLAAGLLFGPVLGIPIAVAASTISAVIALVLVRTAGWQVGKLVSHPRVDAVDRRLRERGWPVVLATRLIPAVPFSVLNYAAGASSIRVIPYTLATFFGVLPGTAAIVILGDALTGRLSPTLVLVSLCTAAIGLAGLAYEIRSHRRQEPSGPFTVNAPNSARNDDAATSPGL